MFGTLPFEIIYNILNPLRYQEIVNFCRAYPGFAKLGNDDIFWKCKLHRTMHPKAIDYVILYSEDKDTWARVYERWETMWQSGISKILQYRENMSHYNFDDVIWDVLHKNVDYVMWLLDHDVSVKDNTYNMVYTCLYLDSLKYNNLNLLKKLISIYPEGVWVRSTAIINTAAEFARMDIIHLLVGLHSVDLANAAGKFGRIDILEYLKGKDIMLDDYHITVWDRKVRVFEWLGIPFTSDTANFALITNKLDMLQWLGDRNIYPSQNMINLYVNMNHKSDVLNWLADNKLFPTHDMKFYFAMSSSSTSIKFLILNWLLQNNIYPQPSDVDYAITHNITQVLQWLFDIGTSLGTEHANKAAEGHCMDTLHCMGDHKIYPDQEHINAAFTNDHGMLEYLKHYSLYPNTAAIQTIITQGAYSKLEWLLECGVFITQDHIIYAALYGPYSILEYLLSKGLYPSSQSMYTITYYGRPDILQWYGTKGIYYRLY